MFPQSILKSVSAYRECDRATPRTTRTLRQTFRRNGPSLQIGHSQAYVYNASPRTVKAQSVHLQACSASTLSSGISPLPPHMPQRIAIKKVVQEAISPSRAPSSTENATSFFLTSPCGPKQKDSSPITAPTLEATRAEAELVPKSGGLIYRNRLVMEQEAGACT